MIEKEYFISLSKTQKVFNFPSPQHFALSHIHSVLDFSSHLIMGKPVQVLRIKTLRWLEHCIDEIEIRRSLNILLYSHFNTFNSLVNHRKIKTRLRLHRYKRKCIYQPKCCVRMDVCSPPIIAIDLIVFLGSPLAQLGKDGGTKSDEFSERFQRHLTPTPTLRMVPISGYHVNAFHTIWPLYLLAHIPL